MSRFRFSMQNILEMKEKLETQAKNEYAQANARLLQEQEKLELLQKRLSNINACLKDQLQDKLTFYKIRKLKQDSEILEKYIELQNNAIVRCEAQVEQARKKLTEAMKDRKIFEKLREKAWVKFQKEELQKEQKEVDELVSYTYSKERK
ncbi:MAG: flagellar export protein FliJ [Eubacterium sp.]